MFAPWFNLALLAAESQHVIALRLWKLARGGTDARDEAYLMVAEKMGEARYAFGRLVAGASPDSVVTGYRDTVQANARRLLA